jgi:putative FmdB family regulatory protein
VPLYEYTCKQCSQPFEELSPHDAAAPCPRCGGADTERVPFSRVAIGKGAGDASGPLSPCGRCGDPRGPGACSMN